MLFGRPDSPPLDASAGPVRVSTEYPHLTRRRYPSLELFFSHGSTEVKVATGLFDYGVCVTETGSSIRDHGLTVVDTLLVSPLMLVAREEIPELRFFADLVNGCLRAETMSLLKMNASPEAKEALIGALPALESPTVNRLADGSYAIETVVGKADLVDLVVKLRSLGASGILVQDLNVILP